MSADSILARIAPQFCPRNGNLSTFNPANARNYSVHKGDTEWRELGLGWNQYCEGTGHMASWNLHMGLGSGVFYVYELFTGIVCGFSEEFSGI